jgi:hypothetical protein
MMTLDGTTTPTGGGGGGGTTGGSTGGTTGGTTGGPTPSLLPACGAFPQVTDPSGDATQIIAADTGQPAASQADLDITKAGVSWDSTASALVATVGVKDLAAAPGNSENLRFDFTYEATQYEIQAQRDSTGTVSAIWTKPGLSASSLGDLTATFDNATSTVTVTLPAADYHAAQAGKPALGTGSAISGISVLSQRLAGVITATADDAALSSDCAYTVAGPGPVVPEVPAAALLPLSGVALLGFLMHRRRKAIAAV